MPVDDINPSVRQVTRGQSPSMPASQSKATNGEVLLDSLVALSKINGIGVVQHGARLSVIGELLVSMLTHLPASTRVAIAGSFRDRISVLTSLSDDNGLPSQYHSALQTEVNRYLNALR